jgi:hypothetical protein
VQVPQLECWLAVGPFAENDSNRRKMRQEGEQKMLWTLVVILLVLWLLGLVTSYTMGGVIHVLLVIAVVVIVVNLIQGRRAL